MERQRTLENDRRVLSDDPSGDDNLDQHREEVDALLRASDDVFDSIDVLDAQQYLEQNVQTGGQ